jgi:hypothetical protein
VGALRHHVPALDAGALRRAQGLAARLPPQRAHLRLPARRGSRMGALTLAPQVRPPPRSCLVLLVHGGGVVH